MNEPQTAKIELFGKPKPFDRLAAAKAYERAHPEVHEERMQALARRHAGTKLKIFNEDPAPYYERGFMQILATRMNGLPVINQKLTVKALPFVKVQTEKTSGWLGCVVTPWSIIAILAPLSRETWPFVPAGAAMGIELESGTYRFVSCADSLLGHYRMCPLKSPVFEFQDMATAQAFADISLNLLLGREELTEAPEEEGLSLRNEPEDEQLPGKLTRRQLLSRYTGQTTQGGQTTDGEEK